MKKETRQKLYELKSRTYECWLSLLEVNQAVHVRFDKPSQDKNFKQEMRYYGDLRRKETWEKAYAAVMARFFWTVNDDNKFLIEFYLIKQSREEGWRYLLPRVIEEYMMLPGGAESLAQGLSDFGYYGCEYQTQKSDVEEFANVYFGTARKLSLAAS